MTRTRRTFLIGTALTLGAGFGAYRLFVPSQVDTGAFFNVDGVAIRGTDPVAYFTESKPVQGNPDFSFDWSGSTWHFASAENRDLFAADPLRYAPQYGGYCAWAVAAKSELYSTQPTNWAIVDDRLYLNFNDGVQERWNEDRSGFISKGDAVWPDLKTAL